MAIKRIPCGGFFYDDESIEFDGKVIKASGGGIIANAVIGFNPDSEDTSLENGLG